ncbi:MAG: HlyD family efflux transporter periplasmic adaptor subunit [Gemmatimonadaceae bacterium]
MGVSIAASGIVRPVLEKHELRTRIGGVVSRLHVREGQSVASGDTVLVLRAPALDDRTALLRVQLGDRVAELRDLELLIQARGFSSAASEWPRTPRYRREHAQLAAESRTSAVAITRATANLRRARELRAKGFVAPAELEENELTLAQARADAELGRERHLVEWQAALAAARDDVARFGSQIAQTEIERNAYSLIAPVAGTIEQLGAVSPESFVQSGDVIGVVSPATTLVAEVWVTSRDIGRLRVGMFARVLVDAFDYAEWGTIPAHVAEIATDYQLVSQQPAFRVRLSLDRTSLILRNGARGSLRKGMTLRARMQIARRSLFHLLTDDASDWMEPLGVSRRTEAP